MKRVFTFTDEERADLKDALEVAVRHAEGGCTSEMAKQIARLQILYARISIDTMGSWYEFEGGVGEKVVTA